MTKKAEKNASTLTGKLPVTYLHLKQVSYIVGRYKLEWLSYLPALSLSTITISPRQRKKLPLIGLQDTLHLISLKLEHTGGLKVITEFHYLSDDLSGNDTIGDITANFGDKITSVIDYGGDRDWYAVEMILGKLPD